MYPSSDEADSRENSSLIPGKCVLGMDTFSNNFLVLDFLSYGEASGLGFLLLRRPPQLHLVDSRQESTAEVAVPRVRG